MHLITYEQFGAAGDGIADDLPAISQAHQHANTHGLPVRAAPQACYYLGGRDLTAIIQTDTDWNTAKFIIDDRAVENNQAHIFEVRSAHAPIPLQIPALSKGQAALGFTLPQDCLVQVTNDHVRQFIRFGLNQNNGVPQSDCFIARQDGTILNPIVWDFAAVTQALALPIDEAPLALRGGIFTTLANAAPCRYDYYARGIQIRRSNVTVEGLSHFILMEGDSGAPYHGFLRVDDCAHVRVQNSYFSGHKTYWTTGSADLPVPMGSYDISLSRSIDVRFAGCRQSGITDSTRWGVYTSNFCKDLAIVDCVFSRWDAHMGCANILVKDSALGHQCLNAIGHGQLTLENTRVYGARLVNLREDYGCLWDGDLLVKDCVWHLPPGASGPVSLISATQREDHDFGYPCTLPHHIRFENVLIDDSQAAADFAGVYLLPDFNPQATDGTVPYPYGLPAALNVSNLRTTSGREVGLCQNKVLEERYRKALRVE